MKSYEVAKQAGDEVGMKSAQGEIDKADQTLKLTEGIPVERMALNNREILIDIGHLGATKESLIEAGRQAMNDSAVFTREGKQELELAQSRLMQAKQSGDEA